jgi:hypothetical protein
MTHGGDTGRKDFSERNIIKASNKANFQAIKKRDRVNALSRDYRGCEAKYDLKQAAFVIH